jgi:hypothetical protein
MLILDPDAGMRSGAFAAAILSTALIFIPPGSPQAKTGVAPYPELSPIPLAEQLSSAREPLPLDTIVDASLAFSGASDEEAASAHEKLDALEKRFAEEVANVSAQAELAEKALTFLHRNLFTAYSVDQTRIDVALDTGVYNCVSSAVLYLVIARSVGLSVTGVRTVDHAFASVLVIGLPVDVETTNPYGFNPGARKDFLDSFGKLTGYSYVPPGNYSDRRPIGEKELLSLILVNRAAVAIDARDFRAALQPAVSDYTVMGTDESRQVMGVALGDYVTWQATRRDFAQAIQFIDAVKSSFGGIVDLEQSRRDVYHNWAVSLIESNQLSDAESLLAPAGVRAALGDADWTDLSVAIVQRQAVAAAGTQGSMAAAAIIADGLRRLGRESSLLQNYEAYVHNAFVPLFNARKFVEAQDLIGQGLSVYPDSRLLQQDLDLARRQRRT